MGLFVGILPAEFNAVVDEKSLGGVDAALLLRMIIDADWKTGTHKSFTVTNYAVERRMSYHGLDAALRRLEAAGMVRHRRVRGHNGSLEILVYDRVVLRSQPRIRGSEPSAVESAPANPRERNRVSAGGNRESAVGNVESAGATSADAAKTADVSDAVVESDFDARVRLEASKRIARRRTNDGEKITPALERLIYDDVRRDLRALELPSAAIRRVPLCDECGKRDSDAVHGGRPLCNPCREKELFAA